MSRSLEELMTEYADGADWALDELYAQLAPRLMGFFRRGGMNEEAAGDLVQQTFMRLHMARGRYRRGAPVKPWIFMIATNLRTDEHRRRGRASEISLDVDSEARLKAPEPDPGLPADLAEALQRALNALPKSQRDVVILHKYQGMPLQEVANVLGCTLSAAKVRAFRAYQAMRREMKGEKA